MPLIAEKHKRYQEGVRPLVVSSSLTAELKPSCVPSARALFAARLCAPICARTRTALLLKENRT